MKHNLVVGAKIFYECFREIHAATLLIVALSLFLYCLFIVSYFPHRLRLAPFSMYRFSQFYLHFVDYNLLVLFVTCRLPVKAQLPFSYFCSRLGCPNLTEASLFVLGLHATSGASSRNIFPYYNMTRMETQNKKDNNEAFFFIV